jgi:RNA-directed DNA polymerase
VGELIAVLIGATGLNEHDVRRIIRNAPVRYKTYHIPKRNGGMRVISQPAREVKALQRAIVTEFLNRLPIHPSATAYRQGVSIRDNAAAHAKNGPILKFDFKNFFPSIVARDWHAYCQRTSLFADPDDVHLSTNILFHRTVGSTVLRLAIGAPASPCLSNVLMHPFDNRISELVSADQVTYTRYADDLTFSAKRTGFLTGVDNALRRALHEIRSPSLTINEEKTVLATQKYKRMVTGLILTNDGAVSIGHKRKKAIRAALHHAEQGKLSIIEQARLGGLLAFVQNVEPEFLHRLIGRYGTTLIADIKAIKKPSRIS